MILLFSCMAYPRNKVRIYDRCSVPFFKHTFEPAKSTTIETLQKIVQDYALITSTNKFKPSKLGERSYISEIMAFRDNDDIMQYRIIYVSEDEKRNDFINISRSDLDGLMKREEELSRV